MLESPVFCMIYQKQIIGSEYSAKTENETEDRT